MSAEEQDAGRCEAELHPDWPAVGASSRCLLDAGHQDRHRDSMSREWDVEGTYVEQ